MLKFITFISGLLMLSCSCKQNLENSQKSSESIQEFSVQSVHYQRWVAGVRGGGSGINVFVKFKGELPKEVQLEKVLILDYESISVVYNPDEKKYIAAVKTEANQMNLEGNPNNEYGNEAPIHKTTANLPKGEVILAFKKDGKTFTQRVTNAIELEMLAYPSARPRN